MTAEQRAACLPRTWLHHEVVLPAAPRVAVVSEGLFYPTQAAGASYSWQRFAPPVDELGPNVLLLKTFLTSPVAEHAHQLVATYGATVWVLDFVPSAALQPADVGACTAGGSSTKAGGSELRWSYALIAAHQAEFIEMHCDGGVDCAIAWCKAGELVMRTAHAKPTLIRSVVLVSTPAAPEDPEEAVAFNEGLGAGLAQMGKEAFAAMFFDMCTSGPTVKESPLGPAYMAQMAAFLERHAPLYQQGSLWSTVIRNSRFWRHWSSVQQPVLLLAGADDAQFLVGMENLALLVPHATIEYKEGVCHIPQIEAPQWYQSKVGGLLEQLGFERRT